ncbi:Matrixin [Limimonas halophila]|uniref:Matrixin n=1 Tax=Limimonas halophila TaxID=1082479 RepID=A0A1G7QM40_9PROT|nr:matrixin family metalloprotease [Limimonas halophila]SDF99617.1 Matrixin [Limimonas halophila]
MRNLALGVVVWVLALAGHAAAADFKVIHLDGMALKWGQPARGTPVTITYALADAPHPDSERINCKQLGPVAPVLRRSKLDRGDVAGALQTALGMWSRAAGVSFRPADSLESADLVVGGQGEPRGIAFTNVEHARTTVPGRGRITSAAICLNPDAAWETTADGDDETYELTRVLAHEIGHVIGLNHPGRSGPLMGYSYREDLASLQPGDRAGAMWLYGPADGVRVAGRMSRGVSADAPTPPALPLPSDSHLAIQRPRN